MFTGIIEEVGKVALARQGRLAVRASHVLQGMELGGSMALNGVCLTVTGLEATVLSVDIMIETLKRSNLGLLKISDKVNLERPLTLGGRLGGHLVQGHVDATGRVVSIEPEGEAVLINFEAPPEVMRYVVEKGFIAVDGVSLTVTVRSNNSFWVSTVDYTREHSTLGERRVGDVVNLEVDIIAKYVEQLLQTRRQGVTIDLLKEQGFLLG